MQRIQPRISTLRRLSRPATARFNHAQAQPQQQNSTQDKRTASFGYKTVPEDMKESLVKNVFDSVASKYDLMNDATSMGVHRLWKDSFVSSLRPGKKGPLKCIDVAGGTGDIALRILDYAKDNHYDRETTVDVVDINAQMLKEGYKRFKLTMYHNSVYIPVSVLPFKLKHKQPHRLHSTNPMLKTWDQKISLITHMTCTQLHLVSGIVHLFLTFSKKHIAF